MDDFDFDFEVKRVLGWTLEQFAIARMYYRANDRGKPPADIFGLAIVQLSWERHNAKDPEANGHDVPLRDKTWARNAFWRVEESEMPFLESLIVRVTRLFR